MKKRALAIIVMCCAFALTLGLAACGGSSSGSAASGSEASSSGAAARAVAEAKAQVEAEAKAALDEGLGYWFGTGANGYDKEEARAAFQQAADKGNAEAWYWLGDLRLHDTEADRWTQVIDYYQKAADSGCAKGWCGLGRLYETGYGVEEDAAKAQELYQQAADAGELYGDARLGYLHEKGKGVEASGAAAAELYEKAASADDFFTRNAARVLLGDLYYRGAEGLEADPAKAETYYRAAADEDYYAGWYGLSGLYAAEGIVHDQGAGLGADPDKKFECDSKLAALGTVHPLAICYRDGTGCEQDFGKAFELWSQEADGGRRAAWSMGGLAYLYANGKGVDRDYDACVEWCNRSLAAAGPDDDGAVEHANYLLDWVANHA